MMLYPQLGGDHRPASSAKKNGTLHCVTATIKATAAGARSGALSQSIATPTGNISAAQPSSIRCVLSTSVASSDGRNPTPIAPPCSNITGHRAASSPAALGKRSAAGCTAAAGRDIQNSEAVGAVSAE